MIRFAGSVQYFAVWSPTTVLTSRTLLSDMDLLVEELENLWMCSAESSSSQESCRIHLSAAQVISMDLHH